MPKPIFRPQQNHIETRDRQESFLCAGMRAGGSRTQQMSKMQMDRLLRKPRSGRYMEAMCRLDNGGHVHNQHKVNDIIDAIRKEFPEVDIQGVLLGVVSLCYLGKPYEVHSLDVTGEIIEHYKEGQTMPEGMEKARGIAMCGSYAFVEVYVDCCRAVSPSGAVAVIKI